MTAPLRVAMVAHSGLGGSGTVAGDLAAALAERGHEVHQVGRPARLRPGVRVTVHEVSAATHPMWEAPPWSLALTSRIAEVARVGGIDVVHAHFAVPYGIAADWARQLVERPLPLVISLHGTDVTRLLDEPAYAPLVRLALSRAQGITVPSRALAGELRQRIDAELDVDIVPNFVDAERFCPDRERPGPEEELVLVHASNFRAIKRTEDVVAVFLRVLARRRARLLLVGDGPTRDAAVARLAAAGALDRVEAPGSREDVESWLRRAHVALLPSEHESFGLVALEAMACGTPVVGSRVGGLSEVVAHGETGWLEEPGDVAAMSDAVLALADAPERWRTMAEAARRVAVSRFSPTQALDTYEQLYRAAQARPLPGLPRDGALSREPR